MILPRPYVSEIRSRNSRFHTLSPNNWESRPRGKEKTWYKPRTGSLTRGSPSIANFEKNFSACSSVPMCTNANCVPVAAISERFLRISARAAAQNGQPKWRRKTSSRGLSSLNAARLVPLCVTAFASASWIVEDAGGSTITIFYNVHPQGGAGTYFFRNSATRVYASI